MTILIDLFPTTKAAVLDFFIERVGAGFTITDVFTITGLSKEAITSGVKDLHTEKLLRVSRGRYYYNLTNERAKYLLKFVEEKT